MKSLYLPLIVSSLLLYTLPSSATVSVVDDDDTITLTNDKISLTIDKESASVTDVHQLGDVNLVKTLTGISTDANQSDTFYLDYHTGVSGGSKNFEPESYEIVSQDAHSVDLKFTGDTDAYLGLEYHFILRDGVNGVYSYVVAYNDKETTQQVAELRTVYRFDARLMPHVYNGTIWGTPPLYSELTQLTKIQDETWELASGAIYTKYDFANYMRQAKFWGVFGHGYGAWFIPASHDYYPGDPLKQELIVHQDGIALNYMTGAHLGSIDMDAPTGWEKLYGPWLVYFNHGDRQHMLNDAARQSAAERQQWPYQWMADTRYAIQRGSLSGHIQSDQPVEVVLTSNTGEAFNVETLGYSYSTQADNRGHFQLNKINPGDYLLSVYALDGAQAGTLYQQSITITRQPKQLNITIPHWHRHVLWQIGKTNRRANEFHYANELRNYKWKGLVPSDLTYTIGESHAQQDWYYAQTQTGTWEIVFNLTQPQAAQLDIAIAAASNSNSLTVDLNGTELTTLSYTNDAAIYRSAMQSGRYHLATIAIPAADLVAGKNTLDLNLTKGSFMYDAIVFSTPASSEKQ